MKLGPLLFLGFNPCSAGFRSETPANADTEYLANLFQSLFCWIPL